ncbi:cyclic nucleotide-binding domain-containing protein [Kamptonema cortianum]|nr:cyclic nucleotide-binding domain-containing protein [Geitlerinema splendidum]MDK3156324.1 cyclic nucleotide-binding domain-containing protein [Kamptonema cortianum]
MPVDIPAILRENYLFQGLSETQLNSIVGLTSVKEFAGGDTIVRQFAEDADLMVIAEGKAKIRSFSGEEIAEASSGSVIGEISLVDDKPRSATVVSAGGTTVICINNGQLWSLMNNEPQIAKVILLNIGRILCARLRAANIALDSVVERAGV